jgi:endogenous inhibitor of DNA gyrase (YacG/DUF329 family)
MSASSDAVCPLCGKAQSPRFAPFCSRRCADLDLGRWLKGSYVIPAPPGEAERTAEIPPGRLAESPPPDGGQEPDGEGK